MRARPGAVQQPGLDRRQAGVLREPDARTPAVRVRRSSTCIAKGSVSLLASRVDGSGTAAPTGVVALPVIGSPTRVRPHTRRRRRTGSQVFFESDDALTSDAPAGLDGEGLSVRRRPRSAAVSAGRRRHAAHGITDDGSRVFFEAAGSGDVELWVDGERRQRPSLPAPATLMAWAAPDDGSALVFEPTAALSGFNTGGKAQVYRYDTAADRLECIELPDRRHDADRGRRCWPATGVCVAPSSMPSTRGPTRPVSCRAPHFFAAGGDRVFFDTPGPAGDDRHERGPRRV